MLSTGLFHVMSDRGKYDFAPIDLLLCCDSQWGWEPRIREQPSVQSVSSLASGTSNWILWGIYAHLDNYFILFWTYFGCCNMDGSLFCDWCVPLFGSWQLTQDCPGTGLTLKLFWKVLKMPRKQTLVTKQAYPVVVKQEPGVEAKSPQIMNLTSIYKHPSSANKMLASGDLGLYSTVKVEAGYTPQGPNYSPSPMKPSLIRPQVKCKHLGHVCTQLHCICNVSKCATSR